MREVVIQSWCDECAAEGSDVPGDPIDITWRDKEYSLDLCHEHAESFREVERLILAHGSTTKKRRKHVPPSGVQLAPNGEYQCPECERTVVNPQGLSAHRRAAHGYVAA